MKKFLVAFIAALMSVSVLVGCSKTPSPTQVTETFLGTIKSQDIDAMTKVYLGETSGFNLDSKVKNSDSTSLNEDAQAALLNKIKDFDYSVSNEKIDGDKATVDVHITSYALDQTFAAWVQEYFAWAMGQALSGASQEEITAGASDMFVQKVNESQKSHEEDVTLTLTKKNGEWKLDALDSGNSLYNAITGGLFDAIKSLAQQTSGK